MWDTSVPMIGLMMAIDNLDNLPVYPLPERYGWRYFRPGDEKIWVEIEKSAGEFQTFERGMEKFRKYYPEDEPLKDRMIFLTDNGTPFSTATAWFGEEEGQGHLHWVSVDEAHQGQGLSKCVVSLAMQRLKEIGYTHAYLTTQTASWVAIRLYAKFGFHPVLRAESEREGWQIVSDKAGMDFMKDLDKYRI